MPGILKDKYFFLSVSLLLAFVLAWSVLNTNSERENKYDDVVCIVFDIKETENGFVFMLETSDGSKFRCFYSVRPIELGLYMVSGNFSDDGSLTFIKKMVLAEHQ